MHTVIAFMTLIDNFEEDDGGREYVLLKYTKIPRESQRMCEAWRTARAAQVQAPQRPRAAARGHGQPCEGAL